MFISHKHIRTETTRKIDNSKNKVGKQKEDCNHSFTRLNKAARLAVGRSQEFVTMYQGA